MRQRVVYEESDIRRLIEYDLASRGENPKNWSVVVPEHRLGVDPYAERTIPPANGIPKGVDT